MEDTTAALEHPTAPPRRKSALAFFALLLLLFLPGLVAQSLHLVGGLVWTELFVFLLPGFVVAAGSNLRPGPYLGLGRVRPSVLLIGALVGVAGSILAMAVMASAQRLMPPSWLDTWDTAKLFARPLPEQVALAAVATLVAPACEEIAFRGYLQTTLLARRGPAAAIAGSTLLFSLIHLDPVRFPGLLVLGAVFGWLAWRAGSVWPAIAAHAANNLLVSIVALLAPEEAAAAQPAPMAAIAWAGALGVAAFLPLVSAFAAVAPRPAPAADRVVPIDPTDPSTRFRLGRVPLRLQLAAFAGAQLLLVLIVARLLSRALGGLLGAG